MNNYKDAAQSLKTHLEFHKTFNQDIESLMKTKEVIDKV